MDTEFIRNRITQLRLNKGISEYQMSYDLGHSRGYIYNISSGKSLPHMKEFLEICEYLEISPKDFFNNDTGHPDLISRAVEGMQKLSEPDILLILQLICRMQKET